MLNVIGHDFSQVDKDTIKMIFGLAKLEEHELRIIDSKYEDVDVGGLSALFVIGKTSIRTIVRELVKSGKLGKSTFVGNDMYNKESQFLFMNVGVNVTEVMTSQENKDFMWNKVQQAVEYYREIFPFDDSLDAIDEAIANHEEIALEAEVPVITEVVTEEAAPVTVRSESEITYNVEELLNALCEMVSLTDPGLTKTLAKYEKFKLITSGGELSVYPTTRIPENEEGFFISFKDLIVLLKFASIIDTSSITIEKKSGNAVS